ncbi:MAG: hypothetical protein QM784_30755 [Polyangiaceae bacterium]
MNQNRTRHTPPQRPRRRSETNPTNNCPREDGKSTGLRLGSSMLVVDELVDVAPAGPSAATPAGVLLLLRDGRPVFAPLSRQPIRLPSAQKTPLGSLEVEPTALIALEHGPVVAGGFTYFVLNGHLLRRKLPNGAIEDSRERRTFVHARGGARSSPLRFPHGRGIHR